MFFLPKVIRSCKSFITENGSASLWNQPRLTNKICCKTNRKLATELIEFCPLKNLHISLGILSFALVEDCLIPSL